LKTVSRINLEIELGKVKETLENLFVEVLMVEMLLCSIAEKLNVDYDVRSNVCVWEVNES